MKRIERILIVCVALILMGSRVAGATPLAETLAQAPTSTPPPNRVEVIDEYANIRAGPGAEYDLVGRMNRGQAGEILGKTVRGQFLWVKIVYFGGPDNTGWVNINTGAVVLIGNVDLVAELPIPPTPTLPPTTVPSINTLFGTATPDADIGRLPTFTPPPPVVRPTLLPAIGAESQGGFPPALAIISLFVLGGFGLLVSLIRQRA